MDNHSNAEIQRKLLETAGVEHLADSLPPLPDGVYELSPNNPQLKDNYVFFYPKTLDDVRKAAGVPAEIISRNRENIQLPESILSAKAYVPPKNGIADEQDVSIMRELAKEIVLFSAESMETLYRSDPEYQKIHEFIMKNAEVLPVLLAANLEVKNGETYTIKKTATAIFDTITVHGTGTILVENSVKVIANTIRQVD